MTSVLGLPADEAERRLESRGLLVERVVYASKRGVEGADSLRAVRMRILEDGCAELTLSAFKTTVSEDEGSGHTK